MPRVARTGIALGTIALLMVSAGAMDQPQAQEQLQPWERCVQDYHAQRSRGQAMGIAESDARVLVLDVATSMQLRADNIVIGACRWVSKAETIYTSGRPGLPAGEYLFYNETWVREVIGSDRVLAWALFGHELGHLINRDFLPPRRNQDRVRLEREADGFAGCAVASMGGSWDSVENLFSRLRANRTSYYPNQLESLTEARRGYSRCALRRAAAPPPIPSHLSPGTSSETGPVLSSETVTLRWTAVPNATRYRLGLRDLTEGRLIIDNDNVTQPAFAAVLPVGHRFRWNVSACDELQCSRFTPLMHFATAPSTSSDANVPRRPPTRISVCNRTGDGTTISVAVVYKPVDAGAWRGSGWYSVDDGACNEIFTTFHSMFYLRGHAADGSVWASSPGDEWHHCIVRGQRFDYTWTEGGCPEGTEWVRFLRYEIGADDTAYTATLVRSR